MKIFKYYLLHYYIYVWHIEWLIGKGVLVLLTTYSHGWARRGSSHVSKRPPWSTRAYQTPSGTSAGASSRQSITKPTQTCQQTIYNYEMSTVCLLYVLSLRRDIVLKAVGPRVWARFAHLQVLPQMRHTCDTLLARRVTASRRFLK